jgi:hypothetical protein
MSNECTEDGNCPERRNRSRKAVVENIRDWKAMTVWDSTVNS